MKSNNSREKFKSVEYRKEKSVPGIPIIIYIIDAQSPSSRLSKNNKNKSSPTPDDQQLPWNKRCYLKKSENSVSSDLEKFTPLPIQEPEDPFFHAAQQLIEPHTRQITLSL